MNLKPSTALRNDYPQVAALAKESGQPIVITNTGEADLVVIGSRMSTPDCCKASLKT